MYTQSTPRIVIVVAILVYAKLQPAVRHCFVFYVILPIKNVWPLEFVSKLKYKKSIKGLTEGTEGSTLPVKQGRHFCHATKGGVYT